jgi:hypothetical protein
MLDHFCGNPREFPPPSIPALASVGGHLFRHAPALIEGRIRAPIPRPLGAALAASAGLGHNNPAAPGGLGRPAPTGGAWGCPKRLRAGCW